MINYKTFVGCYNVKSIKEINDKFDYDDETPHGKGDSPIVACGQSDTYNELEYIYKNKIEKYVMKGLITEKNAIDALCFACHEIRKPRLREDFYKYLSQRLGVEIN